MKETARSRRLRIAREATEALMEGAHALEERAHRAMLITVPGAKELAQKTLQRSRVLWEMAEKVKA